VAAVDDHELWASVSLSLGQRLVVGPESDKVIQMPKLNVGDDARTTAKLPAVDEFDDARVIGEGGYSQSRT
jgi:hypothetical protein